MVYLCLYFDRPTVNVQFRFYSEEILKTSVLRKASVLACGVHEKTSGKSETISMLLNLLFEDRVQTYRLRSHRLNHVYTD